MDISAIQQCIGYTFKDCELLRRALTHRSYGATHNERLEFLGDSVVNCTVALALYQKFPDLPEGELSRLRASLVSQPALAALAQDLALGNYLALGDGELKSGGGGGLPYGPTRWKLFWARYCWMAGLRLRARW